MSRGRGRGGRGGFGGASNLPPMGLTFADIQSMSREQGELYPPLDPLPVPTAPSEEERKICALQHGIAARLRASRYYIVEQAKSDDLPRYSDKYRPSLATRPTLRRSNLHAPFFPPEIFEDYFSPKRRKRETKTGPKKLKLDEFAAEEAGSDDAVEEDDEARSRASNEEGEAEDYDVDEEYDNDYAENYFDNGEGDNADDLGDGGGGGGGDGGDYD